MEVLLLARVAQPPDLFEELLVGHDAPRVPDECGEELELNWRKADLLPPAAYDSACEVDLEVAQIVDAFFLRGVGRGVANGDTDSCQELGHAEGFGEVIVRPRVERHDFVVLLVARRQNDDGCASPFAEALGDLQAIHIGEPEVQKYDVGNRMSGGRGQSFASSRGFDEDMP